MFNDVSALKQILNTNTWTKLVFEQSTNSTYASSIHLNCITI